jgi:hypothetical protein
MSLVKEVVEPAEIAFLEHAFTLDKEGRAVYPELVDERLGFPPAPANV